jgi:adenine-specific DNA-methyltransferase
MQKLSPTTDGGSKDILAENIARLKEIFPEVFAEGKIDFDALKQLLGEYVDDANERYSFTWNGKSQARRIAQTPSMGTLRPCPDESVNWDTTQNLFIEGDNLEVLKLLQKSYYKKIKMIYIDPPYNTGKEFIYPDNFRDSIKNYMELTGQTDTEGRKLSTNAETSGRYHTDWLNMMYPRLKLARNLLRDDGVIFISIDETEHPNLRKLADEVLGEENFIADMVWSAGRKNDSKYISVSHEYILAYVRDVEHLRENDIIWRQRKGGLDEIYAAYARLRKAYRADNKAVENGLKQWFAGLPETHAAKAHRHYCCVDQRGIYFAADISWPGGGGPNYEVLHPSTGKPVRIPSRGWMTSDPAKMAQWIKEDRVHFGETEDSVPCIKSYLAEREEEVPYSVFYQDGRAATKRLRELLGGDWFENPKDETVLKKIVEFAGDKGAIILDFFSGSCTTAHAVLDLNKQDGGSRKFIMVQLPEPCDKNSEAFKAGYKTIADIGKERIRRVIKKLNEEDAKTTAKETQNPALFSSADSAAPRELDRGFKVFKLASSNIKTWDPDFNKLEHSLLNVTEPIKPERSEADVLYEILLKYGLDLTLPIEKREIGGKTVHIIGGGNLVVCLAMNMTLPVVEQIAALKDEFKPETPPGMRVVFKDAGFANNDELKTNAVQILKQHGIEDVRAL